MDSKPPKIKRSAMQQLVSIGISTVTLYVVLRAFAPIETVTLTQALATLVVIKLVDFLLQPIFSVVARLFGIAGILAISIFGYSVIMNIAFKIVFRDTEISFVNTMLTAWIYALVITILEWIFLAKSDEFFLREAIRNSKTHAKNETDTPGFVFVQLDGVSHTLLEWQLMAGNLPNIKKLIDSGKYTLRPWKTQIPSTTPASQAGILFGSHEGIPAFRWYERDTGEIVVANQLRGAQLIESRLSTGKGLLADGGTSIGNLFSGDATKNIMVMSRMSGDRESLKSMRQYSDYFSSLYGFMRAFVLSISEMIKEIFQARNQIKRDFQPRVARHGSYVLLRAGTNVLLRDLQSTIVLDQMMRGTNAIYVDYLDYDEIAHHAGIARPESLDALSGLDRVAGLITKATLYSPRPYHVVFISDHGQSQGPTFKQLHNGKSIEDILKDTIKDASIASYTEPTEAKSSIRNLINEASTSKGIGGSSLTKTQRKINRDSSSSITESTNIVVTGSGNLANVWFKNNNERLLLENIESGHPGLINRLVHTAGIGFIIVKSRTTFLIVSKKGKLDLRTGQIIGTNPLANYLGISINDMLAIAENIHAPDIQIISSINPQTMEVYAFEELVGNHGGIGGWQTNALLLYPSELRSPKKIIKTHEIVDSTKIHQIFTAWMRDAGQRKDIDPV